MVKTEAQKKAQERYIENHKEEYTERHKIAMLKYYYKNKDTILQKRRERYRLNKENTLKNTTQT